MRWRRILHGMLACWLGWAAGQGLASEALLGDAERGRAIAMSRSQGLCILCHAIPGAPVHEAGTLGPSLSGLALRLDAPQRRERLLHPERFNPDTVMPSYGRTRHTALRVPASRAQQALLDAQAVADVLAWMDTLR